MQILFLLLFSFLVPAPDGLSEAPAYAWLEGSWVGDGFGGTSEEVWSAPSADGTMMGVYRHHKGDGSLNFYEFLTLDAKGMHVKHFTPELKAWEEKEDYHTFEMISADEHSINMKGLTFELISTNEMRIELKMQDSEGTISTEIFSMRRQ